MPSRGTASMSQFAELAGIVTRALPKAIEGLDIKEILRIASSNGELLADILRQSIFLMLDEFAEPGDEDAEAELDRAYKDGEKVFEPRTKELPKSPEFTIAGRTYELAPILAEGESSVTGNTMVERAEKLNANLGEEDGAFILKHQDEIPQEFRGKFYLVFTAWRRPSLPQSVAYLGWDDGRWDRVWDWLDGGWGEVVRLVRRVK